jgi:hypothetical protein
MFVDADDDGAQLASFRAAVEARLAEHAALVPEDHADRPRQGEAFHALRDL